MINISPQYQGPGVNIETIDIFSKDAIAFCVKKVCKDFHLFFGCGGWSQVPKNKIFTRDGNKVFDG